MAEKADATMALNSAKERLLFRLNLAKRENNSQLGLGLGLSNNYNTGTSLGKQVRGVNRPI